MPPFLGPREDMLRRGMQQASQFSLNIGALLMALQTPSKAWCRMNMYVEEF